MKNSNTVAFMVDEQEKNRLVQEHRYLAKIMNNIKENNMKNINEKVFAQVRENWGGDSLDCAPSSDTKKLFTSIEGLREQIESLESEVGQIWAILKKDNQGTEIEMVRMTVTKEETTE